MLVCNFPFHKLRVVPKIPGHGSEFSVSLKKKKVFNEFYKCIKIEKSESQWLKKQNKQNNSVRAPWKFPKIQAPRSLSSCTSHAESMCKGNHNIYICLKISIHIKGNAKVIL